MTLQEFSDEEIDENKHQDLLDNVLSINKSRQLKKPSRTEPRIDVSEFDLVKSLTGKEGDVEVNNLLNTLNKKKDVLLQKKIQKAKKNAITLPKPLEKPQAERIRRTVAYEKTRLELDRWEPIIMSNRVSTNLSFPLRTATKMDKEEDLTKRWRLKSIVDEEMEKIYPVIEDPVEDKEFPLSMSEIMERRKEMAKLRAHQSYKEAKARRQNKIKSKKFHRIQRKAKIKEQLKEFEMLQKINPEEALKKLDEIEKMRAHERFSLRHRSTGKWAKNKQIRAKYDKESRQELAQQLTLSKELTQKLKKDDSDSEQEITNKEDELTNNSDDNPWTHNLKVDKEVSDFYTSYKKFWSETNNTEPKVSIENLENLSEKKVETETRNMSTKQTIDGSTSKKNEKKVIKMSKNKNTVKKPFEEELLPNGFLKLVTDENLSAEPKIKPKQKLKVKKLNATSEWKVNSVDKSLDFIFDEIEHKLKEKTESKLKLIKNTLKPNKKVKSARKTKSKKENLLALRPEKKKAIIDEELSENTNENNDESNNELNELKKILAKANEKLENKNGDIDPDKFLNVKVTHLDSQLPDVVTLAEDEENQSNLVAEAFQDDDLVEQFEKEKKDEIEKSNPKDINLNLPGWGDWGGTGVKPNKRKQKRFIIKAPPKIPRKDENKGNLIINEEESKKLKGHMVSDVPFPFQTVKDFEASIRAPIGNSFVPETAFRKHIRPSVRTKAGTIIEPMDKDVLLKKAS